MAFIEGGVVKTKRSLWRLGTFVNFFWVVINFINAFFITLFSLEKTEQYKRGNGSGKKWDGGPGGGGPGGQGRGPYGGGPRGPRGFSDLRTDQDHNGLPACGSCCGG